MVNWIDEVEKEFKILESQTHPGKIRTSARRIAGISLKIFYQSFENNFIALLQKAMVDNSLPNTINQTALRLQSRVDQNFNSICFDPQKDAKIIYEFVKEKILKY